MSEERKAIIDAHRASQPMAELKRKSDKAMRLRGKRYTVEDLDYINARADYLHKAFTYDEPEVSP